MKKIKVCSYIVLFNLIFSVSGMINYNKIILNNEVLKSSQNYNVPDYVGEPVLLIDDPIGYVYAIPRVYMYDYTDVSKIALVEVEFEFTSGFVANKILNLKDYDWHYDLYTGAGYIDLTRYFHGSNTSSSFNIIGFFPKTEPNTITYKSVYSTNYSLSAEFSISVGFPQLINFSIGLNGTVSVSNEESYEMTTTEPMLTAQFLPNVSKERSIGYIYQVTEHPMTLNLSCYLLAEVKDDGIGYYDGYSFVVDFGATFTNRAWVNYWWEQSKPISSINRTFMVND